MILVWVFGIWIGVVGHWFSAGWLDAKLVIVLILSAIHGIQSGKLRKLAKGLPVRPLPAGPIIIVGCVVAIAVLAVVKP